MADLTPRTRSENFLNGEDLEPITRREHFYAGRENELPEGHQEPETREEWFIKKYREAGDVTVESLSITENGTYTAPSGKAYSPVSVNVPLPSNAYLLQTIEHESIATFTDGTDNFLKSLEVAIEPIQSGSGEPSPTNIRPISGWSEANVGVAGKNLFGEINPDKWINADGDLISYDNSMVSQLLVAKANQQYVLSSSNPTSTLCICFYDKDMNKLLRVAQASVGQITATAPVGSSFMYAGSFSSHNNLQLEFGSTPTEYTPYTGSHTYTIDLDGTRYGGKLDVVSGVLTLTDGFISSYNGETLPSTWISDRDVYAEGTTPTTGAEVCYKLATPQTIQLTPTIIKSLQGANNLFASTGEIELLQYWGEVN